MSALPHENEDGPHPKFQKTEDKPKTSPRDTESAIEAIRKKRAKLAMEAKQIIDFITIDAEAAAAGVFSQVPNV
jgi:hypothetical protein